MLAEDHRLLDSVAAVEVASERATVTALARECRGTIAEDALASCRIPTITTTTTTTVMVTTTTSTITLLFIDKEVIRWAVHRNDMTED
jgi:hypothetical protein